MDEEETLTSHVVSCFKNLFTEEVYLKRHIQTSSSFWSIYHNNSRGLINVVVTEVFHVV